MYTKRKINLLVIFLSALVLLLALLLFRQEVSSQNAETESTVQTNTRAPSGIYLNYQGQLLDDNGQPIDATLPMTFELYQTLTGGSACQSWAEAHSVAVTDGVFSVTLGQSTAIPDDCLIDDIYLQLTINDETLSPREQLNLVANTLPNNASTRGALNIKSSADVNPAIGLSGALRIIHSNGNWLGIDQNEIIAVGTNLNLQTSEATGNVVIGTQLQIDGSGQSLITNPADVNDAGGGAFRIGGGETWLGLDNNELVAFGGQLNLQGSGATNQVKIHTSLQVVDDVSIGGALTARGAIVSPANTNLIIDPGVGTLNTIQLLDDVHVGGNLSVGGTCTASQSGGNELASNDDAECSGGSITTGAVIEANLQTQAEMRSEKIDRFELGDLLCWSEVQQQLALCSVEADPLIMAVADKNGKPIVMGAEPIKVLGPVNAGNYLIASNVPGYAIATDQPEFGIVIAQALEDFNGDKGVIKAMIRKM